MTGEEQIGIAVQVGKIEAKMDERDRKLEAIHKSLKDDLARIEKQTTATNGRVTTTEKRLSELKGIGLAFVFLSPLGLYVFQKLTGG